MKAHAAVIALALVAFACGRAKTQDTGGQPVANAPSPPPAPVPPSPPPPPQRPKTIEAVLAAHNDSLMAVPGVLGTAVGRCDGAPCIRVLVNRVTDEVQRRVPRELEGFPVRVDVTGPIVPR